MESCTFQDLETLRRTLEELLQRQVPSLQKYHDDESNGFTLRYNPASPARLSKSGTATCVQSLLATGSWREWGEGAARLARRLIAEKWTTGDLGEDNAYTTAFVLEAVTALNSLDSKIEADPENKRKISHAVDVLRNALAPGYIQHKEYPPSAYLTQLVVRVLKRRGDITTEIEKSVREWASREVDHQLALLVANSKTADLFQLAYAVILASSLGDPGEATPDQHQIIQAAVDQLFERQDEDGSWPRSLALFPDARYGNAYCYEYEMLVQLLQEPRLQTQLLRHLKKLGKAASLLRESAYQIGVDGWGWSSGHHPQFPGPESWATASVFHYAHALDRLVAEAMRRSIFASLDQPYTGFQPPKPRVQDFAEELLDCPLVVNGVEVSLRETLIRDFIVPLAREADGIERGRPFSTDTPMSAILFGPPGTSKTDLTRDIAKQLGWPRLVIDPSHFVRNGLDQVQAEADRIFGMLAASERVVVLLDEFDEMVRDRHHASEVLSRFLTTAMLPKLSAINKRRRIVFIVATNYINNFDLAISRLGRFDRIFQVMPPRAEAKIDCLGKDVPRLIPILEQLRRERRDSLTKLDQLTFGEFMELKSEIVSANNVEQISDAINRHFEYCILNSRVDPDDNHSKKWASICEEQRGKIRCSMAQSRNATPSNIVTFPLDRDFESTETVSPDANGLSQVPVDGVMDDQPAARPLFDLPAPTSAPPQLREEQVTQLRVICEQIESERGRPVAPESFAKLQRALSNRLSARSTDRRRSGRPQDVELVSRDEIEAELAALEDSAPDAAPG